MPAVDWVGGLARVNSHLIHIGIATIDITYLCWFVNTNQGRIGGHKGTKYYYLM